MGLNGLARAVYWSGRIIAALNRRISLRMATLLHHSTLAHAGPRSRFQAGVRFANPRIVSVGADCYIWRGTHASAEVGDATLVIGDAVQINRNVHLDTTGGLTLGARTLISEEVVIYTHDHGLDPRAAPQPMPKNIGADVWIGMRAVILPHCQQIGAGAVIGAGAIVAKDVPAGAIVVGNPARVVGHKDAIAKVAA